MAAPSSPSWLATEPISAFGSAAWAAPGSPPRRASRRGCTSRGSARTTPIPTSETAGIGGFAMATAPAIVTFIGGTPRDALNATLEMYEITVAEHKIFTMPALDFRGTPTGIDLRKVVELGIT